MTAKSEKELAAWEDFCKNGLTKDFESTGSNVVYDFPKMTKRFGKSYLEYLAASYAAKDEMSDEEFCKLNGNVPPSFLNKLKVPKASISARNVL